MLSAGGPRTVSVPAPPSNATGIPAAVASIVSVSAPSPPVIVRLATDTAGRAVAVPSTVTTTSVPAVATEIVWSAPAPAGATAHAVGEEAVRMPPREVVAAVDAVVVERRPAWTTSSSWAPEAP